MSQPLLEASQKSVSFDEDHNEVRESPRVPDEDKADVWLSRLQIRQNKLQAQEEQMMERTRELVKSKLVEEASLSTSTTDEAELLQQVELLQKRLDGIMNQPKSKILAFLQTNYNWITDCNDFWKDLPANIQQAASTLGYTPELWDEFSQQLEVFVEPWQALSGDQQMAAQTLGYNEMTWNGSLEVNASTNTSTVENGTNAVVIEMDEADDIAPVYDWGTSNDSDSSSSAEQNVIDDDSSSSTGEEVVLEGTTSSPKRRSAADIYMETHSPKEAANAGSDDGNDEEEFIANFLSDFTETSATKNGTRSSLQLSYVPSDDEMDLGLEDDDDDDSVDQASTTKNETKDRTTTKATKASTSAVQYRPTSHQSNDEPQQETSPLLGPSSASTRREQLQPPGVGLFRRLLGSSSARNNDDYQTDSKGLPVPLGDGSDDNHSKPGGNRRSIFFRPALVFVPLGLILLYYGWSSMKHGEKGKLR